MNEDRPTGHSPRAVADYYDSVAETWDESYGAGRLNPRFASQVRDNLKLILSEAPADGHALELGAGTGPYVEVTAPLFRHLTATDLSEGMLGVFARRVAALGLTNVTLMQEDACELCGIAAESVDVVYSIGLLETIVDLDRLFGAIRRVLKPGGMVAGITSNGDCPWYVVRKWIEGGERHARTGQLLTAGQLADVLSRSGFGPPEIIYWGGVPPGLHNRLLGEALAAVEAVVAPTPLARYLGVLSFRSRARRPI